MKFYKLSGRRNIKSLKEIGINKYDRVILLCDCGAVVNGWLVFDDDYDTVSVVINPNLDRQPITLHDCYAIAKVEIVE